MALDGVFLRHLKEEIGTSLLGTRVDRVFQPNRDELILAFRGFSAAYKLLISARANSARINLTTIPVENPQQHGKVTPSKLLYGVLTNPILDGIILGTLYSLLPFGLPTLAQKTLTSLSSLTTPLALLSIGASFEGAKAIKKLAPTLVAACCKLMVLTTIFIPIAVKLGFRDQQLIALLIMLGSPTTPSSYVMAKNMGHEGVLTASCVAATTLFSALSLTFWIFVLRSGGYIA